MTTTGSAGLLPLRQPDRPTRGHAVDQRRVVLDQRKRGAILQHHTFEIVDVGNEQRAQALGANRIRQCARRRRISNVEKHGAFHEGGLNRRRGRKLLVRILARRDRQLLELDDLPLGGCEHLERRPPMQFCPRLFHQAIERVIMPERIVMGESKALYSRLLAQPQRVIDRAVTPADLGRILIRGVLPIVDEEIGSFDELRMAQILARDLSFPASQRAGVGLVIAAINHGHPVRLEPIAEGQGGMVQVMRGDLDIVDDERAFDKVMIADAGLELIERDREIGVFHLPGQGFAQRLAEPLGSIDVPFAAGDKKRSKKRDALDVIPMGMADQHMPVQALRARADQLLTKGMCAGPTIQHDEGSAR